MGIFKVECFLEFSKVKWFYIGMVSDRYQSWAYEWGLLGTPPIMRNTGHWKILLRSPYVQNLNFLQTIILFIYSPQV